MVVEERELGSPLSGEMQAQQPVSLSSRGVLAAVQVSKHHCSIAQSLFPFWRNSQNNMQSGSRTCFTAESKIDVGELLLSNVVPSQALR